MLNSRSTCTTLGEVPLATPSVRYGCAIAPHAHRGRRSRSLPRSLSFIAHADLLGALQFARRLGHTQRHLREARHQRGMEGGSRCARVFRGSPIPQEVPEGTGKMCSMLRDGSLDVALILTEGIVRGAHSADCVLPLVQSSDIVQGSQAKIVATFIETPLTWAVCVRPYYLFVWMSDRTRRRPPPPQTL